VPVDEKFPLNPRPADMAGKDKSTGDDFSA
jgi:hypothetical protein